LRGGKRGDCHEVSIVIRVGDGERAGRAPSKVSTMIIRPPQHGYSRAGEAVSASPSASLRERSGAATKRRAFSMLRRMMVRPLKGADALIGGGLVSRDHPVRAARRHHRQGRPRG
jgi:hypothetical protein